MNWRRPSLNLSAGLSLRPISSKRAPYEDLASCFGSLLAIIFLARVNSRLEMVIRRENQETANCLLITESAPRTDNRFMPFSVCVGHDTEACSAAHTKRSTAAHLSLLSAQRMVRSR
jgi:hypothetical protein